jgi:hypothetical protein
MPLPRLIGLRSIPLHRQLRSNPHNRTAARGLAQYGFNEIAHRAQGRDRVARSHRNLRNVAHQVAGFVLSRETRGQQSGHPLGRQPIVMVMGMVWHQHAETLRRTTAHEGATLLRQLPALVIIETLTCMTILIFQG